MTISQRQKNALNAMVLPSDAETIRRAQEFMLQSGMTRNELATASGYALSSLGLYLNGHYAKHHPREANTRPIRAALKQVMDSFSLRQDAVLQGAHYDTRDFKAVYASAMNALENGSAYLVDGPPGSQKTWTLRQVEKAVSVSGRGKAIYVYARVGHSPQSFLIECCTCAQIPTRGTIDQLLRKLRYFLGSERTLLMVDEAQHLDHAGLEVLRQLLDLPPYFGVVLAGSHDLARRLSHWQMEQWRSRLRKTHQMNGLSQDEAERVLKSELGSMPREILDATIQNCRAEGTRNNEKFSYIHARLLFWAVEDAKRQLAQLANHGSAPTNPGPPPPPVRQSERLAAQ